MLVTLCTLAHVIDTQWTHTRAHSLIHTHALTHTSTYTNTHSTHTLFLTCLVVLTPTVKRGSPALPVGTNVIVRLRQTRGSVSIPKMRWLWAIYTILTQKEQAARQDINAAIVRLKQLHDRAARLVRLSKDPPSLPSLGLGLELGWGQG